MSEKDVASESNLASPSSRKEVLLREVLHALKQEIYLFTPLGLLSFVNRAGGDALGGALEELTGLPWGNLPLFQGLGEPFAVAWRDLPSSCAVRAGRSKFFPRSRLSGALCPAAERTCVQRPTPRLFRPGRGADLGVLSPGNVLRRPHGGAGGSRRWGGDEKRVLVGPGTFPGGAVGTPDRRRAGRRAGGGDLGEDPVSPPGIRRYGVALGHVGPGHFRTELRERLRTTLRERLGTLGRGDRHGVGASSVS